MDTATTVKLALYDHIATTARVPSRRELAGSLGATMPDIDDAFRALAGQRLLVLERDSGEIRMAPPFSAIETPHHAVVGGRTYAANCVWDAFGVVAALGGTGVAVSRSGGTGPGLRFQVRRGAPDPSDAVFHYAVPAARWWEDIVFT